MPLHVRFGPCSLCGALFALLFCSAQGLPAQTAEARSAQLASSLIAAFRTSAHVERSSPLVFNQAVDGVVEFLRSSSVVLANDSLRDPSRSIPRLQGDMSREDFLAVAKTDGASYLLLMTVDRPTMSWLKLQLECFDGAGKLLWEEQASYGGGVNGGSAVPKTLEKLKHQLQADGVKFHSETDPKERALYSAIFIMAMNPAKYDSLPADLKKVIDNNSGAALVKQTGKTWDESAAPGRKAAEDRKNTFYMIPASELANWRTASASLYDEWVAEATAKGNDGKALLAKAQGLIKKYEK